MCDPTRVLLVDDVQKVRQAVKMFLTLEPDLEVVGEAEDGESAILMASQLRPDVVVMDLAMPGLDGIAATAEITKRGLTKAVVILSIHGLPGVRSRALAAGASAFLEKGAPPVELVRTIRDVCGEHSVDLEYGGQQ